MFNFKTNLKNTQFITFNLILLYCTIFSKKVICDDSFTGVSSNSCIIGGVLCFIIAVSYRHFFRKKIVESLELSVPEKVLEDTPSVDLILNNNHVIKEITINSSFFEIIYQPIFYFDTVFYYLPLGGVAFAGILLGLNIFSGKPPAPEGGGGSGPNLNIHKTPTKYNSERAIQNSLNLISRNKGKTLSDTGLYTGSLHYNIFWAEPNRKYLYRVYLQMVKLRALDPELEWLFAAEMSKLCGRNAQNFSKIQKALGMSNEEVLDLLRRNSDRRK